MREGRKRDVEEHVETVNRLLRESLTAGDIEQDSEEESAEEWDGFPDQPDLDLVDHEEEYIDEDRFTTVTVESVAVSRDGLFKPSLEDEEGKAKKPAQEEEKKPEGSSHPPKKKKKKFRYETKFERQLTERKAKAKKAKRRE